MTIKKHPHVRQLLLACFIVFMMVTTGCNQKPSPDISFITPVAPPVPPILLINPEVMNPSNLGQPLTLTGIYSSGLLSPGGPGLTSYTSQIGDISGNVP
jgi:hypothetical protein